jgi:hypothetical protein
MEASSAAEKDRAQHPLPLLHWRRDSGGSGLQRYDGRVAKGSEMLPSALLRGS